MLEDSESAGTRENQAEKIVNKTTTNTTALRKLLVRKLLGVLLFTEHSFLRLPRLSLQV